VTALAARLEVHDDINAGSEWIAFMFFFNMAEIDMS
jgi:hypothetical protein